MQHLAWSRDCNAGAIHLKRSTLQVAIVGPIRGRVTRTFVYVAHGRPDRAQRRSVPFGGPAAPAAQAATYVPVATGGVGGAEEIVSALRSRHIEAAALISEDELSAMEQRHP
jgi:hypothetical protein